MRWLSALEIPHWTGEWGSRSAASWVRPCISWRGARGLGLRACTRARVLRCVEVVQVAQVRRCRALGGHRLHQLQQQGRTPATPPRPSTKGCSRAVPSRQRQLAFGARSWPTQGRGACTNSEVSASPGLGVNLQAQRLGQCGEVMGGGAGHGWSAGMQPQVGAGSQRGPSAVSASMRPCTNSSRDWSNYGCPGCWLSPTRCATRLRHRAESGQPTWAEANNPSVANARPPLMAGHQALGDHGFAD